VVPTSDIPARTAGRDPVRALKMRLMSNLTSAQKTAIDTIRAAGGFVVRHNFRWDGDHKIAIRAVRALVAIGYLKVSELPLRGSAYPVKYTLV